jgi:predicted lipoprotein with Yx(FWY)xxD motif
VRKLRKSDNPTALRLLAPALAVAAVLVAAACGSSSSSKAATSGSTQAPTTASNKGVTISTANVAGFGTVLVNAKDGRTLYLLTSEAGGKVTCTDANGCTKVWPDTELPEGVTAATAGPGVNASLLGTAKGPTGDSYVTYGGYPLYEFAKDTKAGDANGQGITSFGGTWYVIDPGGMPITKAAAPASSSPPSSTGY